MDPIARTIDAVTNHPFRPVADGMTIEPSSEKAGVEDFSNDDWLVRTRALRDLVRAGGREPGALVSALREESAEVRYLAAAALGILEADEGLDALHDLLTSAPESTVRSQAAISLGQIAAPASERVLEGALSAEEHRDVEPQCRIALDAIRAGGESQRRMRETVAALDERTFRDTRPGDVIESASLPSVDGEEWLLEAHLSGRALLLLWVFADWCPVCHHEFNDLIERKADFERLGVEVATLECHDTYRAGVMAGNHPKPRYWYSHRFENLEYGGRRWWPHVMDHGGALGARVGVDPLAFAVHSEFVNRPATVIVDPDGRVTMSYVGTFWGDRPTIGETLDMIESGRYEFRHPERSRS